MDFKYPYTDFHELNLDWFLAEFKKLTADWLQVQHDWEDQQQAFQDLHDYVQDYFANLNLYQEVHDILYSPEMQQTIQLMLSNISASQLPTVVANQIASVVASQLAPVVAAQLPNLLNSMIPSFLPDAVAGEAGEWLATHVDPDTGYVIDDTLTIQLAAADAKAAGDAIKNVEIKVVDFEDDIASRIQSRNLFNGNVTSGYIGSSGVISPSTTYHYSDKIDVSTLTGKTLYFGSAGISSSIRFLCAYDSIGNPVPTEGSDSVISSYTVPTGIHDIVISFSPSANSFSVEADYLEDIYTSFYDYYTVKKYQPVDSAINIPKPDVLTATTLGNMQSLLFDDSNSIKRGDQTFDFYCKIPNGIGSGFIVIGKDSTSGYSVGISATKFNYFVNGNPLGPGLDHGLTLKDYIAIRVIIKDSDGVADIYIRTNGGSYYRNNTSWNGDAGKPFVENRDSVVVTDVAFTWTCEAFRKRIWVFGDSYVSIAAQRWPYYLYDWGYNKNILINGFPGENSRQGFYNFLAALKYGIPSIAVWAYGMNDTDNGAINTNWLTFIRLFLQFCAKYEITPILATIPCIPTGDNSYKNAWVRSSGYRYIEFANAVNVSQDSTTWFDNMLSSDNVHPDVEGAIALANRALVDVPEFMIN